MSRFVVHPGYGKTATTTLQTHLFAKHSGLHYLGRHYPDPAWETALRRLIFEDSAHYDPAPLAAMAEAVRRDADRTVLLSEEVLLSPRARDTELTARRLKEAFGPCAVLLTLRSQPAIIASYYAMHGRRLALIPGPLNGTSVTYADWFAHQQEHLATSYLSLVRYYEVVEVYARVFGRENLHVGLFEEFTQDQPAFLAKLCAFLDIDAGEARDLVAGRHEKGALSNGQIRMQLLRSRFLPGVSLTRLIPFGKALHDVLWKRLARSGRFAVEMTPEQRAFLHDLYAPGNRRLAEAYGLPLERFGYPL